MPGSSSAWWCSWVYLERVSLMNSPLYVGAVGQLLEKRCSAHPSFSLARAHSVHRRLPELMDEISRVHSCGSTLLVHRSLDTLAGDRGSAQCCPSPF